MATAVPPQRRWFFGPVSDLLFGCGLLYAGLFAWQALAGPAMRSALPYSLFPLLTLLLGAPHYGATLLRVYESRSDRRKYWVFSVHITILLALAYVAGLYSLALGSVIVTVYVTWSPWHYSGQNYGIAALFLRRRGVPVSRSVKRLLYGCFVLPYVLVFMAIHNPVASANRTPGVYEGTAFHVINLGIPTWVQANVGALVEIAYLACLVGAAWGLKRRARWRDLGPAGAVVLTQALWFTLPTVAMQWGWFLGVEPLHIEFQQYALMWVAVGHFLQYLWITTYYAASAEDRAGRVRYLGKAMLAGNAIWVFPTLVFAPGILGRLPFDLGLGLLTASVVNIHHFILDGAIWKLRDGAIARVLLRDSNDLGARSPSRSGRDPLPWIYGSVLALGAMCTVVSLGTFADDSIASRARANGDVERLRRVQERRAWMGRDSPRTRLILAQQALRAGDLEVARENVERSLALHPTPDAYLARARLRGRAGDRRGEMEAYRAALEIDPDHVEALHRSGLLWLRSGRSDLARGALRRALSLDPGNPDLQDAWRKMQNTRDPPASGNERSSGS